MPNNTTLEQDETPSMSERGENFADILSQYEQSHTHKPEAGGQGLTGTVIAVSPEQVFIDIGQKIEGVMPVADFRDPDGKVSVRVGDQFPVSIKGRNEEGYIELSKVRVDRQIEGVMPVADFRDPDGKVSVRVGDQFPVSIKGRNEEGYIELSKVRVERPKDWSSLEAAFNEKRSIAGVVSGVVKGGLSVDVGVRAFMP